MGRIFFPILPISRKKSVSAPFLIKVIELYYNKKESRDQVLMLMSGNKINSLLRQHYMVTSLIIMIEFYKKNLPVSENFRACLKSHFG